MDAAFGDLGDGLYILGNMYDGPIALRYGDEKIKVAARRVATSPLGLLFMVVDVSIAFSSNFLRNLHE